MNERTHPKAWTVLGLGLAVIAFLYLPAASGAQGFFDPPKRLGWSLLLMALGLYLFRRGRMRVDEVTGTALLLLGYMVVRTAFRPDATIGLDGLFAWSLPVVALLVGAWLPPCKEGRRIIATIVIGLGLAQLLLMLLQYAGLDPLFAATTTASSYRPGRMIGTIGYHNQAADCIALCSAGLLMRPVPRTLRLAGFSAVLFVVALSGSRGALVALTAALVAVIMITGRLGYPHSRSVPEEKVERDLRARSAVGILLGVVVLVLLLPGTRARFGEFAGGVTSTSLASRLWMMKAAWMMWLDQPLFGWGAGEYAYQYMERLGALLPETKTPGLLQNVVYAREAHNDFLQGLAEFGLVGAALGVALLVSIVRRGRDDRSLETALQAPALWFVLVYLGFKAWISFPLQTSMCGPFAALLLGLTISRESVEPKPSTGRLVRVLAAVLFFSTTAGLCWWNAVDNSLNLNVTERKLDVLDSVLGQHPLPGYAHSYKSVVGAYLASQGELEPAREFLVQAEKGYRDPRVFDHLSHVLFSLGQHQEALPFCEFWVASGLTHQRALRAYALALEEVGQSDDAITAHRNEARLWPEQDINRDLRVGRLQYRSGRFAASVREVAAYVTAPEWPAVQSDHRIFRAGTREEIDVECSWIPVALRPDTELHAIVLPNDRNIRILALSLVKGKDVTTVPLLDEFTCDGFAGSGEQVGRSEGFDLRGYALPTDAFPANGHVPVQYGGAQTYFILGPVEETAHNVIVSTGQRIELPRGDYERLDLLAAAVDSPLPRRSLVDVVYGDRTVSAPVKVSDWCSVVVDPYGTNPEVTAKVLNLAGIAWMQLQEPGYALHQLQASIALNPQDPATRINRDRCLQMLNQR